MDGFSLKSRAIAFAVCAGAVVFILALAAVSPGRVTVGSAGLALTAAIVCGVLSWASAERSIASTAGAIDAAIDRMATAAKGDLEGGTPEEVRECVPQLADAMDALFSQLHTHFDHVRRLAMFDPVTGLPNRTHFRQTVEGALAELPSDAGAVLYFIDLDRFKSVNDTLGHAQGDVLLGMVASRLRGLVDKMAEEGSEAPLVGRLAGDEFTLFAPGVAARAATDRIGHAILVELSKPFELAEQQVTIGASIGVATRPHHGATLHDLMRAADAAMYHAKSLGRGRFEHFTDTLAARIEERVLLEGELREAVEKEEFSLVFQPQVSARDGSITGAEALLRWRHRDGIKLPGSFIERAEETGLIVEIGAWVVTSVAETISRWGRLGIEQRLAVNISPRQIDHAGFFRQLRAAMHAARAPASLLELEISETLAMNCSGEVLEAIAALRADGASIAIDDFGTGYSNVARLRELPVDRVKLDRCLVEHVVAQPEARTIAQAIVGLIHGLGCQAVAEGVESEDQAAVLRVIGCDVLQGYCIAAPMAEAEFLDWTRKFEPRRAAS
ncbi:MAG: EAL domain-containing protein [Sphingomonas sp.]|uniref:putative bifunctional diguanylate cyclase/phosphodiesterase n=1 Tax=Sphingomonas sp. TaxID=28214 RepID=UPI001B22EF24|nr:EAL domain-containing protein [Sphingomonas sp.]MBO9622390.1 EAL domain-containing protein [Sphingomonas sp.]